MSHPLEELRDDALREIAAAPDEQALEAVAREISRTQRKHFRLGRADEDASKEERPIVGKLLNEVRTAVTAAIEDARREISGRKRKRPRSPTSTFRCRELRTRLGTLHPLTQMLDRAISIFRRMGFALADGPDIEDEWHCFDALNTPPDHPARNEQDTFYLPDGRLLRTHTSTVQIRTMQAAPPPIRVIAPGAAYRRDEVDATHSAQFHQIEGLYVDENVSVADLKGTLEFFMRELFGAGHGSAISSALFSVHRAEF